MNKKILYLIGAIVGVAAVTLLTSQKSETPPAVEANPAALPANGLPSAAAPAPATATAPVAEPAATPDATDTTDAPENDGTAATDPSMAPAGSDELPAGAEVAPQGTTDAGTDPMSDEGDEKVVPPSEGQ